MQPSGTGLRRVLVTGGSGFIGGHLVGALLQTGAEVRNADFVQGRHVHPRLSHWAGSFLDASFLREALVGTDCVYHLAATNFPRESNRDPRRDAEENIIGSLRLLDEAVEAGVRRFVFCSSGGTVYGPARQVLIGEEHPTNPTSAYGVAKLAVEKYLRLYTVRERIQTLSVRVANPFGPHQNIRKAQGAVTTFCHRAILDEVIDVWGDGSVERDFVYIDDVVDGLVRAGSSPVSGAEINIGSGRATSLLAILAEIEAVLKRPVRRRFLDARSFDVPSNYLDISRARQLLGWSPKVTLPDGIRGLIHFMQEELVETSGSSQRL